MSWWEPDLIAEISKKYKVLIFDNRGVGKTDKPDMKYSIKMMTDDTVGLMTELGIERAHILGISMGGAIAQEVALNYPEKVEKLVLCSTTAALSTFVKLAGLLFKPLLKYYFKSKFKSIEVRGDYLVSVLFSKEFIQENPAYIEKAKERLLLEPTSFENYMRQLNAMLKHGTAKRLKNLEKPTLIMHGKQDDLVDYKASLKLADLIPYPKLALFNKSAHSLFSQETDKVLSTLLNFLA
jgi:pimeloyl-ACP methyl ester carboxylesterase